MPPLVKQLSLIFFLIFSISAQAISFGEQSGFSFDEGEEEFLPVDEAFQFTTEQQGENLLIHWTMADGYYLYHKRFKLLAADQALDMHYQQKAKVIDDPSFGSVKVYYFNLTQSVPLSEIPSGLDQLTIKYQGCADAGLCYPPQKRSVAIPDLNLQTTSPATTTTDTPNTETAQGIQGLLQNLSLASIIGLFFVLGLGLTFTPCVLPMVPILSSIIVGQKNISTGKAFSLSLSYVLGMAITYAAAGVLVGLLGGSFNIQAALQNPWVLGIVAAFFAILSLSMFGYYELRLPSGLQNKLNDFGQKQKGGTYVGVFIMGALSALVVSPCVSAPLAGALVYISTTGDALLGGSALLAMGLGMGAPLMVIGVGGSKLMPKAGGWMDRIKEFFGVLLLAVAIWLISRLIPGELVLILWSVLLGVYAIQLGALDAAQEGLARVKKGLSVMLLLYAGILMLGAFTQGSNPLDPLKNMTSGTSHTQTEQKSPTQFTRVNNLDELNAAIKSAGAQHKTVMFDFYADWCISCIVMEHKVFSDEGVKAQLENFVLLQVDMTDNTAEHKALLDHFGLFGPPSILFFATNGEEIVDARIQGDMNLQQFSNHLQQFLL